MVSIREYGRVFVVLVLMMATSGAVAKETPALREALAADDADQLCMIWLTDANGLRKDLSQVDAGQIGPEVRQFLRDFGLEPSETRGGSSTEALVDLSRDWIDAFGATVAGLDAVKQRASVVPASIPPEMHDLVLRHAKDGRLDQFGREWCDICVNRGLDLHLLAMLQAWGTSCDEAFHGQLLSEAVKRDKPGAVRMLVRLAQERRWRIEPERLLKCVRESSPSALKVFLVMGKYSKKDLEVATSAAVQRGAYVMTSALLAAGADPNAADPQDRSLLAQAAMRNRVAVICRLAQAGADVNHKDRLGRTAADFARGQGMTDSEEMLKALANERELLKSL